MTFAVATCLFLFVKPGLSCVEDIQGFLQAHAFCSFQEGIPLLRPVGRIGHILGGKSLG